MPHRKKKIEAAATRTPEEQAICDRYPDHTIKPGSLLAAADPNNPYPGKRVVTLVCACGAERQLCTSDLFHVKHCVQCAADVRKNRRDKKKQEK